MNKQHRHLVREGISSVYVGLKGAQRDLVSKNRVPVKRDIGDIQFQSLSDLTAIEALEKEWNDLHQVCTCHSIYNSFDFVFTSITSFVIKGVRPLIITMRIDNRLAAIFPFQINLEWWMYAPMRTIQYNALEETDKPYPLFSPDLGVNAWGALLTYLNSSSIKFDRLSLIELRNDANDISTLEIESKNQGNIFRVNADKKGPIIDLALSWDDFWNAHPKMRKKVRKMEKDYSSKLSFKLINDNHLAIDIYSKLEALSWKKGKVGITKNSITLTFYQKLFKRLNQKNALLLGVLYLNDDKYIDKENNEVDLNSSGIELISAEIAYIKDENIYFCHGCYNDNFKKYSPGMVSTSYFLKYFFQKIEYKKGDFLCGYAGYLDAWSETVIETSCVDVYRPTVRVRTVFFFRILKRAIGFIRIKAKALVQTDGSS